MPKISTQEFERLPPCGLSTFLPAWRCMIDVPLPIHSKGIEAYQKTWDLCSLAGSDLL